MANLNNMEKKILPHLLLASILMVSGSTHEPEFDFPLPNLTAKQGTDVSFTCVVKHLGNHKVAWIKADEKVILAFHTHMVTQNQRFIVTHNGHNTWTLHIKGIQQNDTGSYMCQVNTNPARNQIGTLEVVVPADIIDEETSNDVIVKENDTTELKCKASGYPTPKVRWRRQDGQAIPLRRELAGPGERIEVWEGEKLPLRALQKADTGAYYCIANNSVPPLVSKRVMVYVQFPPMVSIQNQLVAAPLGNNVTLECKIDALPKPIASWFTREGTLILSKEGKYSLETEVLKDYSIKTRLTIANFSFDDVNDYNCSATNSLGSAVASVKLINYTIPETPAPPIIEIRKGKHGNSRHQTDHERVDGGGKNIWSHPNRNKNTDVDDGRIITNTPHNNDNLGRERVTHKGKNSKGENHGQYNNRGESNPIYNSGITTQSPYYNWSPKNSGTSTQISALTNLLVNFCLPFILIPLNLLQFLD